jgi:hypothetical protein
MLPLALSLSLSTSLEAEKNISMTRFSFSSVALQSVSGKVAAGKTDEAILWKRRGRERKSEKSENGGQSVSGLDAMPRQARQDRGAILLYTFFVVL